MASVKGRYNLKDFPFFFKDIEETYSEAAKKGMLSAGFKIQSVIQTQIIPKTQPVPVDRGIYRAGWTVKEIPGGFYIYNKSVQALFIEEGVKKIVPGPKMVKALAEWVKRKGFAAKLVPSKKSESGFKLSKTTTEEAIAVAWAIIKSAQKKGGFFNRGRGLRIFEKAMQLAPTIIRDEVYAEIRKKF